MMTSVKPLGKISVRSNHEVEWVIEDFFSYKEVGASYSSPQFIIKGKDWFMHIYPNGETSENTGWISLYLSSVKVPSPVGVIFNFALKKVDGSMEYRHLPLAWVYEGTNGYGNSKFLERSELQRREAEFMLSNALTVVCSLRTLEDFESTPGPGTLSGDLVNMFLSKNCCDATLNVMGEKLVVHRSILSARSSVFDAMFEVDMKEKTTGTVEITDCDPESFREFLFYLYSGKIEKVPSDPFELYKIADKYNVGDLKCYCFLSILLNLSVDNVLDAYAFGCHYDIREVKQKTQKFFNKNFPMIVQTAKWKEFLKENTTIANELLEQMAGQMIRSKKENKKRKRRND